MVIVVNLFINSILLLFHLVPPNYVADANTYRPTSDLTRGFLLVSMKFTPAWHYQTAGSLSISNSIKPSVIIASMHLLWLSVTHLLCFQIQIY